jgi:hypothetical protein
MSQYKGVGLEWFHCIVCIILVFMLDLCTWQVYVLIHVILFEMCARCILYGCSVVPGKPYNLTLSLYKRHTQEQKGHNRLTV